MISEVMGYVFSDEKKLLQLDAIKSLLHSTYWAKNRSVSIIEKSIENSLCFGIYKDKIQIGFARCVTDFATFYWLCDVIIDNKHRKKGLGKELIKFITQHNELKTLKGVLATRDVKGLYEKYGFKLSTNSFMMKR